MAALTADRRTPQVIPFLSGEGATYRELAVAASTVIYKGGFVGIDTAGNLVMYASPTVGTTIVGGYRFMGIAMEHIASQTSATAKRCLVMTQGTFRHTVSSTTVADVGKPVFASDDNTLTISAAGNAYVGNIVDFISADGGDECVIQMGMTNQGTGGIVWGMTPIIAFTAANKVTVIPKSRNSNGLYVYRAVGICTTNATDAVVVTLKDTAGTTLGITFTSSSTVAGDKMVDVGSLQTAAGSAAQVLVPAGLGVDVEVTTTQAAGAGKFWVECIPGV